MLKVLVAVSIVSNPFILLTFAAITRCRVENCGRKHHTLLHRELRDSQNVTTAQNSVISSFVSHTTTTMLGVIPVKLTASNGKSEHTLALLDNGSDKTLLLEDQARSLGLEDAKLNFQ